MDWVLKNTNTTEPIRDVYFTNFNTGYCVGGVVYTGGGNGSKLILKTTDNGETWEIKLLDNSTNSGLSSIFFTDSSRGYAVGSQSYILGIVMNTTDAGNTWHLNNVPLSDGLESVCFTDGNTGYAVGSGVILKTTTAGVSWYVQSSIAGGALNSIQFIGEDTGYVAGYNGRILKIVDEEITPVELISFSANRIENSALLSWQTTSELNNNGFEVERSLNKINWATIGFVKGAGTTSEPQQYNFTDNMSDFSSTVIYYRLKQLDFNGSYKYSDIVQVEITPTKFELSQNYPNPFNPSTKISWQAPVSGWQTLKVYDILGNEVATLVDEYRNAGSYEVDFNPASSIRNPATGVYFYQLRVGNYIETKKMILLK